MQMQHGPKGYLEYGMARTLQAQGMVRIIDEGVLAEIAESMTTKDADYLMRESFMKYPLTRVAWIQNYIKNGGAELTNFHTVKIGHGLGFDIVGVQEQHKFHLIEQADISIVNNLHFEGITNSPQKAALIDALLASKKPYIVFSHDLFESEKRLFMGAKLSIFLSPSHRRYYQGLIMSDFPSTCLPLAIDTQRYTLTQGAKRVRGSCLIPTLWKWKDGAVAEFCTKNKALKVKAIGGTISRKDNIPYSGMPAEYAQHEYVAHYPDKQWAGERVLFEAVLCGCKVLCDKNSGHMSWSEEFDWQDPNVLRPRLEQAPFQFWKEVDRVLNAA